MAGVPAGEHQKSASAPIRDVAAERWQLWLESLPEAQRNALQAKAEKMAAEEAQRRDEREKRKKEVQERRARHQERRTAREERLKAEDPAGYEERLRQREKNRQELIDYTRRQMQQPAAQ